VFAGVGITQVVTGYIIDAFPADAAGNHPEAAYRWMFAYLAALVAAGTTLYGIYGKFGRRSNEAADATRQAEV
jgi:hypothetical protein